MLVEEQNKVKAAFKIDKRHFEEYLFFLIEPKIYFIWDLNLSFTKLNP